MNRNIINSSSNISEKFVLQVVISFGIFFFILFFQPFPLQVFEFNNQLLIIIGFGVIIFFSLLLGSLILSVFKRHILNSEYWLIQPIKLEGIIALILSNVAITFYLRYVGLVPITFYVVFKEFLVCISIPIILIVQSEIMELKRENEMLVIENRKIHMLLEQNSTTKSKESITFHNENFSEKLTLIASVIIFIKSADNYVEFILKDGETIKKKLLRNTLKNIGFQVQSHPCFIKCHRTIIVNKDFIEILHNKHNKHWIEIKGYPESIPISRQYLLRIMDIIEPVGVDDTINGQM